MSRRYYPRERYFAWNGGILLVVGVILLLDRMDIVPLSEILRFWPMLLVAGGTVLLAEMSSLVGRAIGSVLLGAGLILEASNLGYLHLRGEVFWPLVLIGVGVVLLVRALEERNRPVEPAAPERSSEPPRERPDFAERFRSGAERFVRNMESANGEHASVFSHVARRVTDQNLERLKVAAVFGGFELDLREAGMRGDEAMVEADAVFGGIEIVVPEEWEVIPRGAGVFGGFSDETRPPETRAAKRLIVTGAGVFGGVIITNEPRFLNRRHRRKDRRWQ